MAAVWRRGLPVLRWVGLAAVALGLYAPALGGPFLSDDLQVVRAPLLRDLDLRGVGEILDPFGAPAAHTANYAPLHLLAHGLLNRIFGPDTTGPHVVNVLLHALNALLLMGLLREAGLVRPLAVFAGLVFLVHPAQVEAVAWIFQLKTQLAFALAVGALRLQMRRPAVASALFAAALLCKIQAVFALPVAAVWLWARPEAERAPRRRAWLALAAWLAAFALVSIPELAAFRHAGEFRAADAPDLAARVPFILEIAARYLLLASTSLGASSFHQPAPPASLFEPAPLIGLLALLGLGARALRALWLRRVEAAFWVWAAAGFAPVSQIFPFLFPMADRYLYFILPGLLGGFGLWVQPWLRRLAEAGRAPAPSGAHAPGAARGGRGPAVALAAAAAAVLLLFSVHTWQRAHVWSSGEALLRDAAAHYPHGAQAHLLRATEAALARRGDEAIRELEGAVAQGFHDMEMLRRDASFSFLHGTPGFQALLEKMAAHWIARTEAMAAPTAAELERLGRAHAIRGEHAQALRAFERALARARPDQEAGIRMAILRARGALARARREQESGREQGGVTGGAP